MLMRSSARRNVVHGFRKLILPLWQRWEKLVRAAEILDQWGERDGAQIDWRAMCVGSAEMTFAKEVMIERYALLAATGGGKIRLGDNAWVGAGASLRAAGGDIEVGERSYIGFRAYLGAGTAGIRLGKTVLLGPYVSIIAEQHRFDVLDKPIVDQGMTSRGIVLEDDVWVGAHACILDGVTIGKGSVVGAGAVVTKNVPPYSVVAGIPAKVIKQRKPSAGALPSSVEQTDGQLVG